MPGLLDGLPPGMGNMLIMMPVLYLGNVFDYTQGDNMLYLRVAFCTAQLFTLIGCAVLYFKITAKPNQEKITVKPPPPPPFGAPPTPPAPEIMTITEYDLRELKKIATQVAMSFCITGFLHYKWELTPPLFIQCIMTPKSLLTSPLFQIFVLNSTGVTRPFPEPPSPFAALMPEAPADTGRPRIVEEPSDGSTAVPAPVEKSELKKKRSKSKKAD